MKLQPLFRKIFQLFCGFFRFFNLRRILCFHPRGIQPTKQKTGRPDRPVFLSIAHFLCIYRLYAQEIHRFRRLTPVCREHEPLILPIVHDLEKGGRAVGAVHNAQRLNCI